MFVVCIKLINDGLVNTKYVIVIDSCVLMPRIAPETILRETELFNVLFYTLYKVVQI
jgi:hypothetical protein